MSISQLKNIIKKNMGTHIPSKPLKKGTDEWRQARNKRKKEARKVRDK